MKQSYGIKFGTLLNNMASNFKNAGRQPKSFPDSPLFHFFLINFCRFAKKWPHQNDISRIGIIVRKHGEVPTHGYPILWELCSISAMQRPKMFTTQILAKQHKTTTQFRAGQIFLTALRNSPDFTLQLLCYARKQLAKCSQEKKEILFQSHSGKFTDRQKTVRAGIRKIISQNLESKKTAAMADPKLNVVQLQIGKKKMVNSLLKRPRLHW